MILRQFKLLQPKILKLYMMYQTMIFKVLIAKKHHLIILYSTGITELALQFSYLMNKNDCFSMQRLLETLIMLTQRF